MEYALGPVDPRVPVGQTREWPILNSEAPLSALAVGTAEGVFVYLNRCPHTGAPLNWLPNQFLSEAGDYLQCSTHFALFERDTGRCVLGPCTGQSLQALRLEARAYGVWLRAGAL